MTLAPRRPRVLLDVDGVAGDFHLAGRRVIEEVTGRPAPAELATKWNVEKCYEMTPAEEAKVVRRFASSGFCSNIPPFPDAIDGVRALREIADVYVVTAPFEVSPTWRNERDQWLARHFGFRAATQVIHTESKFLVKGDVFVDDKPLNVIEWQAAHPSGHGFLWRQPYNGADVAGAHLIAHGCGLDSWPALYDFVKSLCGTLR